MRSVALVRSSTPHSSEIVEIESSQMKSEYFLSLSREYCMVSPSPACCANAPGRVRGKQFISIHPSKERESSIVFIKASTGCL